MPKILISTSSFDQSVDGPLAVLKKAGFEVVLNPYGRKLTKAESVQLLNGCSALIAGTETLDREVLSGANELKVISRVGVGTDNVCKETCAQKSIQLFNTPDAHVDAVAELAVGGILNLLRHIALSDRQVREGQWQKKQGSLLKGRKLGLIGAGRVGQAVAAIAEAFGAEVAVYDPFYKGDKLKSLSFQDLLKCSDIVSLHLPYNKDNHHLINADSLGLMKQGSYLVNTARGGLICEDSLIEALKSNAIAGAYLDTFENEPYEGPLKDFDNVLLTPHIGSYAAEARGRQESEAVSNVISFFNSGVTV